MENYLVVLFKNKVRKRIIKKFVTLNKATLFYNKLIDESEKIIFDVKVENGHHCNYEMGLIELNPKDISPIYLTDDIGRNTRVKLEEQGMALKTIKPYRKEEFIFDIQKKKKIKINDFIKEYLSGEVLKMVSIINNKIVVQKNETISLFSLKNPDEASRFIDSLSNHFFKIKRADCLFVKDYSTPQKKYLFDLLEKNGIDKKILYRKFTTFPLPSK